ncbi:hypothetical protein ACROYT_G006074 [Oculina patagonica]
MEGLAMWVFHITAWGIPLVIAVIAYLDDAVGSSRDYVSSGWCWIKYTHQRRWWKMVLWMCIAGKGWEILAYIAITVFYVLVKLQIRRELKTGFVPGSKFLTLRSVEVAKKADKKLMFIPVVFILLRIWGTIRFIRFLADYPEDPSVLEWLVILHGIGDNSQGFANFVLFCLFTDKIRNKFRLCCGQIIPWCRRSERDGREKLSTEFFLKLTGDDYKNEIQRLEKALFRHAESGKSPIYNPEDFYQFCVQQNAGNVYDFIVSVMSSCRHSQDRKSLNKKRAVAMLYEMCFSLSQKCDVRQKDNALFLKFCHLTDEGIDTQRSLGTTCCSRVVKREISKFSKTKSQVFEGVVKDAIQNESLVILMIDDWTKVYTVADNFCTIVIKVIDGIRAIPVQDRSKIHNSVGIDVELLSNHVLSQAFMQKLSCSFVSTLPELSVLFFDPLMERQRLEAHNYHASTVVRSMRSFDDVYLLDFVKLPLKSRENYETSLGLVLQSHLKEYLSKFVVLLPGDWPSQFYPRQIVYSSCSSGRVGAQLDPVTSIVPCMGPLHVDLNADEDIMEKYITFVRFVYESLFPGRKLADKPKPWRTQFTLEVIYGGWTLVRNTVKAVFSQCKDVQYGVLLNLLDNYIPLALATYDILFKLNRLNDLFLCNFQVMGYVLLLSQATLQQVTSCLDEQYFVLEVSSGDKLSLFGQKATKSHILPLGYNFHPPPNPQKRCDSPSCGATSDMPWKLFEGCWHSFHLNISSHHVNTTQVSSSTGGPRVIAENHRADVTEWWLSFCQSNVAGQSGSNACTIIAVLVAVSFLLPTGWVLPRPEDSLAPAFVSMFKETMVQGNIVHQWIGSGQQHYSTPEVIRHPCLGFQSVAKCGDEYQFTSFQQFSTELIAIVASRPQSKLAAVIILPPDKSMVLLIGEIGQTVILESHQQMQAGGIVAAARPNKIKEMVCYIKEMAMRDWGPRLTPFDVSFVVLL